MSETPKSDTKAGKSGGADRIIDAEAEPIKQPAKRGVLRTLLLGVLAVVVCVGIAAAYYINTMPPAPASSTAASSTATGSTSGAPPVTFVPTAPASAPIAAMDTATQTKVQDLERRIAALSSALERLNTVSANTNAAPAVDISALESRIADLEVKLATQAAEARQRHESTLRELAKATEKAVDLDVKLTELANQRQAGLRQPVALLLAWQALREHALLGQSFEAELAKLSPLVEREKAKALSDTLAALTAFSSAPAKTQTALIAAFPLAAEAQMRDPAPAADAPQPTWWQRAIDKLSHLITIRRVGGNTADSTSPDGKLAAAEAALAKGDLAAALRALDGLDAHGDLAGWKADAEARLKLQAALERFTAALRDHFAVEG